MKKHNTNIKAVLQARKFVDAPLTYGKQQPQLCKSDCPECGGSGWVRAEVAPGDLRFGQLQPCGQRDIDADGYGRKFGLKKAERDLNWSAILPMPGSNAVDAARRVREVIQRGYGWVYLWGTYGNAKSLILQVAAAVGLRAGMDAAYVRMAEILDHLREGYSTGEYSERLDWLQNIPILCIDEFEKVNESKEGKDSMGWAGEKRFVLMDNRYVSATRGQGITIMAGNANPAGFDGYLWDRIRDGRFDVIRMTGESARPGMDWDESIPLDNSSVFATGEREHNQREYMQSVMER